MSTKEKNEPGIFRRIFLFLKSKRFRIHFIIAVIFIFLIFWGAFKSLAVYTLHGETISVPDFSGIKTDDLDKFISEKKIKYQIIDSVFDSNISGGIVIRQDPEKNSSVKQNRTIYLTVSAKMPPLVKMPNLVDASMRQALAVLESYGLKAGKREYKPDPCINCVIAQMLKGKKINAGEMIPKGSVIDLILGQGQDGEKISVPCVIGLSQKEAIEKLAENGMSEGAITCTDCKISADKEKAKVYKQNPACSAGVINPGSSIDLVMSIHPQKNNDDE
ncbi:MAG: PASTA domain-containing protein [Bacteroidetes bacterium]|nr:PASTA domain-containing protein [Bacteroidota bacterium]